MYFCASFHRQFTTRAAPRPSAFGPCGFSVRWTQSVPWHQHAFSPAKTLPSCSEEMLVCFLSGLVHFKLIVIGENDNRIASLTDKFFVIERPKVLGLLPGYYIWL